MCIYEAEEDTDEEFAFISDEDENLSLGLEKVVDVSDSSDSDGDQYQTDFQHSKEEVEPGWLKSFCFFLCLFAFLLHIHGGVSQAIAIQVLQFWYIILSCLGELCHLRFQSLTDICGLQIWSKTSVSI